MANSKNVHEATDSNFSTDIAAASGLTMIDFWAE